ncbi:hypothetical protein L0659_13570 [Dyadobacter sp. CY347]|nr:hypothetical protein [Dyadobacter sp. CY347]
MYHTGIVEIAVAEDIVQEAFALASEKWHNGIPERPDAWLYKTIRNTAYNLLKKEGRQFDHNLMADDQHSESEQESLRVLFGFIQPELTPKVQLIIALRNVSGLKVQRIAALLASDENTITKILYRWKIQRKSQNLNLSVSVTDPGEQKIRTALKILYLMFTEGYRLSDDGQLNDETLCEDALCLAKEMVNLKICANGEVKSLYALMLYNLARASSRLNALNELIPLAEHDRSGWNQQMIGVANQYFLQSQKESTNLEMYQLEASIAYLHITAQTFQQTKWHLIIRLYDKLMVCNPSPFTALSHAAALYFSGDHASALKILDQLKSNPFFQTNHLLHCLYAKIALHKNDHTNAVTSFKKALNCKLSTLEMNFVKKELQLVDMHLTR